MPTSGISNTPSPSGTSTDTSDVFTGDYRQLLLGVPPMIAALATLGPETTTYTYDAKGRLVTVLRDGAVTDVTTAYQYDRADNRTRLTTTGSPNPAQP